MLRTIAPRPISPLAVLPSVQPPLVIPIRGMAFEVPKDLKLKPGMVLRFVNMDDELHTVTAVTEKQNGEPLFRSPMIDTGESFLLTVDESMMGPQSFFCELHPMMRGEFTVEPATARLGR